MKLTHPETGGVFETTQKAYENAWKAKGWVPADEAEDTPDGGNDQPPWGEASATVDDVLDWVGDDEQRAAAALAYESKSPDPRKGIVGALS